MILSFAQQNVSLTARHFVILQETVSRWVELFEPYDLTSLSGFEVKGVQTDLSLDIDEVNKLLREWQDTYNWVRLHQSLGSLTP